MKNLILVLNRANLTESDMETVLTEFDIWLDSKQNRSEQKLMTESIAPIQRETDGIRNEVRILAETMKNGFEKLDQKWEDRFQRNEIKWEERFQKLDQKMDFINKNLTMQSASNREYSDLQISRLEKQILSNKESLEKQISATRENLETQIKANEKSMEKQFSFQQKLLWAVLSVVLGLFAKAIHLI